MILFFDSDNNSNQLAPSCPKALESENNVKIDWNPLQGAINYTSNWSNSSVISNTSSTIVNISFDNYRHSNLDNGSKYYYKVSVINSSYIVGYLSVKIDASRPLPAPDSLSVGGSNNTVTLT